ncbi:hypothetical protein Tsp_05417 [Trichinella spiralis]|uniref:hypothetical protein n=1 Tax=Trichinella spiralis TaxID=6334 RepID=UPI0001EFD55D|nr:hypothetical protein Tsp_05417 [Trichinella spiralis]
MAVSVCKLFFCNLCNGTDNIKFYLKYQNSYFVFASTANNFDLTNTSRSLRFTKSVQQAALKSNTMINQIMIRNGAVVQFSQYIHKFSPCSLQERKECIEQAIDCDMLY